MAGGKSRRMGEDKALLPFGDFKTLTEYQLHKLQPHFDHIYISCKNKNKFNFEANFIEDNPSYHDSSPLIALLSSFQKLQCQNLFVISVDTPFIQAKHFHSLYHYHDKQIQAIVAETISGTHPLCALYTINPFLLNSVLKKKYKMTDYLAGINTHFVNFEDESLFANLNFQEEYQKALKRNKNG
jgi:molybdopterin-guanine dinucleotide biosynthesis protein A